MCSSRRPLRGSINSRLRKNLGDSGVRALVNFMYASCTSVVDCQAEMKPVTARHQACLRANIELSTCDPQAHEPMEAIRKKIEEFDAENGIEQP
jgi:hypothetical protein